MEGRAVRSSVRWRLGLEVRFALPVALRTVRSDTTILPARDVLCPRRESSSLRRLFLRLELRTGLPLSMSRSETSRGRSSSRGGMAAGDFGGVGKRNGDAVSAGSGDAHSQSWIRSSGCEEKEEREEGATAAERSC